MAQERGRGTGTSSSDRTIIFACCGGLALLAVLAVVGTILMWLYVIRPSLPQMSRPGMLDATQPVVGEDLLAKSTFFEDSRLGPVTDIAIGDLDGQEGEDIVAVGRDGAAFLALDGTLTSFQGFPRGGKRAADVLAVVDVDGDGVCEYLRRGDVLWSTHTPELIGHDGQTLWTLPSDLEHSWLLAPGDVDGDGELEFAGSSLEGLFLLESDGALAWRQPLETGMSGAQVQMMDMDGDGQPEVVHSRMSQEEREMELVGRDRDGKVTHSIGRPIGALPTNVFMGFTVCRWPTTSGDPHVLTTASRRLELFDLKGETVLELEAEEAMPFDRVIATPVALRPNQPHVAVLVVSSAWEATFLHIYDAQGEELYREAREMIDPDAVWPALRAWQPPGEDMEVLLAGGANGVWEYRLSSD